MVCPNCGRVLAPGEICTCKAADIFVRDYELKQEEEERIRQEEELRAQKEAAAAERARKAEEKARKAKNHTADASISVVQAITEIIRNPYDGIADFAEDANIASSLILMGLHALFGGIVFATFFSTSMFGRISLLVGPVNRIGAGIIGLVICLIAALVNAFAIFMYAKTRRNSIEMKQALALGSAKYSLCAPLMLVSVVLMALNWLLGLCGLAISVIVGTSFDSISMSLITEDEKSRLYGTIITNIVPAIVYCVGLILAFSLLVTFQ